MGVVGSGKTTVGSLLAQQLGWEFVDGDSFHSPANVAKMRRGEPLTDADRGPWLQSIHEAIVGWVAQKKSVVLACSALKRSYRERLSVAGEPTYVYLKGSYDVIRARLHARQGHFATEQLLASQFAALEEPAAPENVITVDVSRMREEIVAEIRQKLSFDSA